MNLTTTTTRGRAYWVAQWTDANGRQRRKSLGRKDKLTKRAARKEIAKLLLEHDANPGLAEAGRAPTLGDWCSKYLTLQTDYAEATTRLYEQTIEYLKQKLGADRRIDRISRADAAGFRAWLADGKGLKPNTVAKHIANAKAIFGARRGALKLNLISSSPFDRESSARTPTHRPTFDVDAQVLAKLLEFCPTPAWRALLSLCRLAGTRLGEALRLRWQDIDWDRRQIRIIGHRQTTKTKTRITPMVPQLHDILLAVFDRAPDGEPRVCHGINPSSTKTILSTIRRHAGLPQWQDPFHTLRRCCATEWLNEYGPALESAWLGHTYGVARDHYHTVTDQVWEKVTQFSRIAG